MLAWRTGLKAILGVSIRIVFDELDIDRVLTCLIESVQIRGLRKKYMRNSCIKQL